MMTTRVFPRGHCVEAVKAVIEGTPIPIIAVAGLPAAGKTTLARQLAAAIDAHVVDKDQVAAPFEAAAMAAATGDPHDRDSEHYRTAVLPHTLSIIRETVLMLTGSGSAVIIDSPFLAQARYALATGITLRAAITATTGIPVSTAVWLTVDHQEQQRRMIGRGEPRDTGKLADFTRYRDTVTPFDQVNHEHCDVWGDAGAVFAALAAADDDM